MPLHGGICEFDPEHTPLPQDFDDPELPEWFPTWLHNYHRRDAWAFSVFGPMPPVSNEDIRTSPLAPVRRRDAPGIPASQQRHAGAALRGDRPLCPECLMPLLVNGLCPLEPNHGASQAAGSEAVAARPVEAGLAVAKAAPAAAHALGGEGAVTCGAAAPAAAVAAAPATGQPQVAFAGLPTSIEAWLREMDEVGFLAGYHDILVAHFDSPAQVIDIYVRRGQEGQPELDPRFFSEMGIQKLGHRRLFEKWFARRRGGASGGASAGEYEAV